MAYDEIDRLYEDILSRASYDQLRQRERAPAGAMSPAATISPERVLNANNPAQKIDQSLNGMFPLTNSPQEAPPQDTPFPDSQLQPLTLIQAPPFIDPIEPTFQDVTKRKPEYIENYRGNANRRIEEIRKDSEFYAQKRKEAESTYNVSKDKLLGIIDQMGISQEPFQSEYDYDAKIKQLQNMQDLEPQQRQAPEENATAEIIRALGAPLLGAMTGETGAIAQRTAQTEITRQGEKLKKDMADREKTMVEKKLKLSEEISKRMVAIRQLKEGEYESYDKNRKANLEQLKLMKDAVEKLTDKDQDKLKAIADTLAKTDEDVTKSTMEGSKEVSKMEENQAERDAQMERLKLQEEGLKKRAVLGAKAKKDKGVDLPLDKKEKVKIFAKKQADMSVMNDQISALKNQIRDKSIPESERIVSAREQLKLINSQLGKDAVGAEEAKRLSAYLEIAPNVYKGITKFGADIEAFADQLDRVNKRVSDTIQNTGKMIDDIYGRPAGKTYIPSETKQAPSNTKKIKIDPAVRLKMIKEIEAKRKK